MAEPCPADAEYQRRHRYVSRHLGNDDLKAIEPPCLLSLCFLTEAPTMLSQVAGDGFGECVVQCMELVAKLTLGEREGARVDGVRQIKPL